MEYLENSWNWIVTICTVHWSIPLFIVFGFYWVGSNIAFGKTPALMPHQGWRNVDELKELVPDTHEQSDQERSSK